MNPDTSTIIGLIWTAVFIHAIFSSSRRLASFGHAILASVLAFVFVFVLGMVSTLFFVPSHASVAETNKVLDMIAGATTIGVLVAAVIGARMLPRRMQGDFHNSNHDTSQAPFIRVASDQRVSGIRRLMKPFIIALMVVALVIAAWGFGRWSAQVPTPEVANINPSTTPEVTPEPTQAPVAEEGTKSTPLSLNIPDGVPSIAPYSAMGRTVVRAIPDDTEPVIYREDWKKGLSPEQVTLYAEGLIRSGLEDLGLCKPGYTCHATLLYRLDEQSYSPHGIWMHMTLTTRSGQIELYYYYDGRQMKSWQMTDGAWRIVGVVEDLPEQAKLTQQKLMASWDITN